MRARFRLAGVAVALAGWTAGVAAQQPPARAAEVVGVEGTGEHRATERQDWQPAQVKQGLGTGEFVRTGELSRMGLLFADQTQIRLNQHALLQIKQVGAASGSDSTVLSLLGGRAWSQSKVGPKKLLVETPAATAAIRGTDWELSVDEQGAATLTVLSGEVEFYNEFGTLIVRRNEQARALVGQPPVRLVLTNPRDRVQWVTAYAVEPLRHISLNAVGLSAAGAAAADAPPGGTGPAVLARANQAAASGRWDEARSLYADVLTAEPASGGALLGQAFVALHDGDPVQATNLFGRAAGSLGGQDAELLTLGRAAALIQAETFRPAVGLLEAAVASGPTQPAAHLLLADLMMYMGETERALAYLDQARERFPQDARIESLLARISLLTDRPAEGRRHVQEALEHDPRSIEAHLALGAIARTEGHSAEARASYLAALALNPSDARAWHGLGTVHSEREEIRPGRMHLRRALELDPVGAGLAGELGTLETFANRLGAADDEYRRALERTPDDYVALTGRALLALKRGRAEEALDLLLRATLLEPRYARAHMYMAVAYYRLGRVERALEELDRASELDPRDPFPHMLKSIVHNDVIDPGSAIDEGRTARRLMPYLKSLNQLANNQKGTANLGSAFAFFGMEEWALHLAQESYYPYWAGSHLFLGDRYAGSFTKNSEYFQGSLTDPTVFGASPRYQTLVPKPGVYLNTGFRAGADSLGSGTQPYFTLNGYSNDVVPVAYFLDVENTRLRPDQPSVEATQNVFTGAVGTSLTPELGLLGFANHTESDGRVTAGDLVDASTRVIRRTVDVGGHYRLGPTSIVWVKAGGARDLTAVAGPSNSRAFDEILFGLDIDVDLRETVDVREYQARHTLAIRQGHDLSWGAEVASRDKLTSFVVSPRLLPALRIPTRVPVADTSRTVYVSDRVDLDRLTLQADLFLQRSRRRAVEIIDASVFGIGDLVTEGAVADTTVSPRLGAVYRLGDGRLIRYAHQRWVRPASVATLSPVDTVGVPLDDRLVALGGTLRRNRIQAEWEWTGRTFTYGFFDYRSIQNPVLSDTIEAAPNLEALKRLRNFVQINTANEDLLEEIPQFQAGIVRSGGVALNQLLSTKWSVYSRLFFNDSENTGRLFLANRIPWLPGRLFSAGATWVGPRRFYVSGQMVHRTERFEDEANLRRVPADWRGQFQVYWEAPSKRWSLELVVNDAFSPNAPTSYGVDLKFRH